MTIGCHLNLSKPGVVMDDRPQLRGLCPWCDDPVISPARNAKLCGKRECKRKQARNNTERFRRRRARG